MTTRDGLAGTRRFRFAEFEADLRTGELFKRGQRVKLADQPLQILPLLVERRGELVTREELCDRLWTDETYVDFDRSLNTAVRTLRRALGDSPRKPRFIETLPKRGYRFIAKAAIVEVAALNGIAADGETTGQPQVGDRRSGTLWGAAAAIGLLLLGFFAVRSNSGPSPAARADEQVGALPGGLDHVWGAISPDGSYLARRDGDNGFLYLFELASGDERLLVPGPVERGMVWSPDSKHVAYTRDRDGERWVESVETEPGTIRPLLNTGPVRALPDIKVPVSWDAPRNRLLLTDWRGDWLGFLSLDSLEVEEVEAPHELVERDVSLSPNGRFLGARTAGNDIVVLPVDGQGEPVVLTASDEEESFPVWNRDGRKLLFYRAVGAHRGNPEVWAAEIDPESGVLAAEAVRLGAVPDLRPGIPPIVSDGGEYLWAKQEPPNRVRILEVDPATGKPTGAPARELPVGYWGGTWTSEGAVLRVNSNLDWPVPGMSVLRKIDAGTGAESLIEVPRPSGTPYYSADLTLAAVTRKSQGGGSTLLLYDAVRDGLTEIASSDVRFSTARVSQRGRSLAFLETAHILGAPGTIGIAHVESRSVRRLYSGERMETPVWSPDDSEIAFVDRPCVYILHVESGGVQRLTCYATPPAEDDGVRTASPKWSPDGSMLVWAALNAPERRHEVWVIDRATGSHRVIWTGEPDYGTEAWDPTWSADGRYMAFAFMDSPPVEIWRVRHPFISQAGDSVSD